MLYFPFFYSILFLLLVFSFLLPKFGKAQDLISFVLIFFLFLTFCFSFQHGVDWLAYYNDYYDIINYPFEFGYRSLVSFFSFFTIDFWVFSAVIKLCLLISLFFMLKRLSIPYAPVVTIFFVIINYHLLTNVLRQDIAMGVVFIAIPFLLTNAILFFALISFASLFHLSAVIILILYVFYKSSTLRNIALFFVPVFLIFGLLKLSLLSSALNVIKNIDIYPFLINKLVAYFSQNTLPLTAGFFARLFLFVVVSITFYVVVLKNKDKFSLRFFNVTKLSYSAFLSLMLIELLFFQTRTVVIRLGLYYSVFIPMSLFCSLVYLNILNQIVLRVIMIIYLIFGVFAMVRTPFFIGYYLNYNNYFVHLISPEYYEEGRVFYEVNKFWDSYVPP